jgi:hypothetical protein
METILVLELPLVATPSTISGCLDNEYSAQVFPKLVLGETSIVALAKARESSELVEIVQEIKMWFHSYHVMCQ